MNICIFGLVDKAVFKCYYTLNIFNNTGVVTNELF